MPRGLRPSRWALIALAGLTLLAVLGWRVEEGTTRDTAERVARSIRAHSSCASVVVNREPRGPRGAEHTAVPTTARRATAIATVECRDLGGFVDVLTFASSRERDAVLHADAQLERSRSCLLGRQLIVDGEIEQGFLQTCREVEGQLVAATRGPCPLGTDRQELESTPREIRLMERERHGGPCAFPHGRLPRW